MAEKGRVSAKRAGKNASGIPQITYPGDIGYTDVEGPQISADDFTPTDTTFNYDPVIASLLGFGNIQAGTVTADRLADRFMTAADYTIVDPTQISSEYGDIARRQIRQNATLSSELALEALATELKGLQNFAPSAAALQRQEIAKDNAFNQAQREAQLAAGDPNLRADLEAQRSRAQAFASGRLPDSIQDRAYELGVRSRAADAATSAGFGARSGAARKASELMSAEARIGLSQYGDQLLTNNIGNRSQLLLAPTSYSQAGSQISAAPTQSGAQVAQNILGQANDKTIISSETALANQTQQQQFRTGLEQSTRQFNTGLAAERDANQAQLNLQAQTTNVGNQLQADIATTEGQFRANQANVQNSIAAQEINQRSAIQTQSLGIQTRSQESQFQAQLNFNAKNANADRAFQAANVNAGRAVEVASSNRNARLDVQKFNKNLVFQDLQQRRAEAAANARAGMAASASMANAALSAQVQRESLAANIQMQREGFAFQLDQQSRATELYKETRDREQTRKDVAAGFEAVSRLPAIINGVSSTASAIQGVYDYFNAESTIGYDPQGYTNTQANLDVPAFSYSDQ